MTPTPSERERWTMTDIAAWLTARGRPTKYMTFKAMVHRRQAPAPDGRSFGHPWWWPATIQAWEEQRPGRGARTDRDAPGFRFWKLPPPS